LGSQRGRAEFVVRIATLVDIGELSLEARLVGLDVDVRGRADVFVTGELLRRADISRSNSAASSGPRARPRPGGFEPVEKVERLAYTRAQAGEALGISLATLDRRVVPTNATVATEWGGRLIPVAAVERYLAERTQTARDPNDAPRRPGRRAAVAPELPWSAHPSRLMASVE
jgi:hypothetical protein